MFAVSRLNAAMLTSEPDAIETPLRRTGQAQTGGLVIGALVIAVILVIGLLDPGASTSSWKASGELVTVQTTGAQYLYSGGALHPVANYASARLLDEAAPSTATVAETALAGVPLGTPVGIAGAPADLPAASALSKRGWLVCGGTDSASGASPAAVVTTTVVAAGTTVSGLPASEALPVAGPDGTLYLIWDGQRLQVGTTAADAPAVALGLGYATASWTPVSAAFLDTLPTGPGLTAPDVPGEGGPGPALDGRATRTGQLFEAQTASGTQFYQLQSSGLVPVTPLEADLIEASPQASKLAYAGAAVTPVPIDPATAVAHLSPVRLSGDLPQTPPQLAEIAQGQEPCATVSLNGGTPTYGAALVAAAALGPPVEQIASPASPSSPSSKGSVAVTRCAIAAPTGVAVLARAVAPAAAGVSGIYLVTDEGVKYPLSSDAVTDLGYTAAAETPVPAYLLSLLLTGPALTPAAATADPDEPGTAASETAPAGGQCPT